jgi:3-phenylpropionate/trans-cinnamate dioxygenase ferredoxin reductase subunit
VLRGDPSSGAYLAFYLGDDGTLLAGMHVNVWDSTDALRELVRSKKALDPGRLVDPEVPLSEL